MSAPASNQQSAISNQQSLDAQRFRYIAALELNHTQETPVIRDLDYVVMASDGTPHWGKTYTEAVDKAMAYDRSTLFWREAEVPLAKLDEAKI